MFLMARLSSVGSSSINILSLGSAMPPEVDAGVHPARITARKMMAESRVHIQQAREMVRLARVMRADAIRDTTAARKMRDRARKIRASLKLPENSSEPWSLLFQNPSRHRRLRPLHGARRSVSRATL